LHLPEKAVPYSSRCLYLTASMMSLLPQHADGIKKALEGLIPTFNVGISLLAPGVFDEQSSLHTLDDQLLPLPPTQVSNMLFRQHDIHAPPSRFGKFPDNLFFFRHCFDFIFLPSNVDIYVTRVTHIIPQSRKSGK